MASTVSEVLREHPRNIGTNAHSYSESSKQWARTYSAMKYLSAHPIDGASDPFEGHFQPLDRDHSTRMAQPRNRPNNGRDYLLDKEMDGREWFNAEIINPVLSAFTTFPSVRQSSETGIEKVVDTVQSISQLSRPLRRGRRHTSVWQTGRLGVGHQPHSYTPGRSDRPAVEPRHRVLQALSRAASLDCRVLRTRGAHPYHSRLACQESGPSSSTRRCEHCFRGRLPVRFPARDRSPPIL
jgi:hypothetical protein